MTPGAGRDGFPPATLSTDTGILLKSVPRGSGRALDLGGGSGGLKTPLEGRGYEYHNVDSERRSNTRTLILGDAHGMPFADGSFSLVVSNDSLEHFLRPEEIVREVKRVLNESGRFVIQVPFMHPFHGNDTFRYTPLGLRYLLTEVAGFEIIKFESPLWLFSLMTYILLPPLHKVGLGIVERPLRAAAAAIDQRVTGMMKGPSGFAAAYVVVATVPPQGERVP